MTSARRVAAVLLVSACATRPPAGSVHAPTTVVTAAPLATDDTSTALVEQVAAAPAPLSADLIAWAVLTDGVPLVRAMASVGQMAPPRAGTEELAIHLVVARLLGLDARAVHGLDLLRPAAVAYAQTQVAPLTAAPPWVALVPITSRAAVEEGLAQAGLAVERQAGGIAVTTPRGKVWIDFGDGKLAAIAFRPELTQTARALLAPVLARPAEAPLSVHLDVARLYALFGAELEVALGRFARATESDSGIDPQIAFALRNARRFTHFADSLLAVDVLLGADDSGLGVTARVDGRPGGAFTSYVASQRSGPPWGLGLIPADAVLLYATHRNVATAHEELDAAVDYLGDSTTPAASDAARAGWRDALERAIAETAGDFVYGVWPGDGGGVGLGGAFRVKPGARARRATLAAYRNIGPRLAVVVGHAIGLDAARFPMTVRVHADAGRIGGAPVDALEISVRWPAGGEAQRRLFRALFGDELVLYTAFVDDNGLFTLGHGGRARLAKMVAAARHDGAPSPSLADDARLREALAYHAEGRISFTWLPTAAMAGFIDRLLRASHTAPGAPPGEALLIDAGDGCIVAATNAAGARYQLSTHLPASSLPGLPRIGGLLWRMALSPLLNPPLVPPLPLPPAHVSPAMPDAHQAHDNAARPDQKL